MITQADDSREWTAVSVAPDDPADGHQRRAAAALAVELGLSCAIGVHAPAERSRFRLAVTASRVELHDGDAPRARPLFVDFVGGPTGFRRRSGLTRRQAIARAVGMDRGAVRVVDATAGLGRDAFLFACLGCHVMAMERSPVLFALLRDGLARARCEAAADHRLGVILDRMTLLHADARDALRAMVGEAAPDAVYLDPMYPPSSKSALPKRELRICRALVGDDPDAAELFTIARAVARRRVVVKRSPHAGSLVDSPTHVHAGRRVRYDVYTRG